MIKKKTAADVLMLLSENAVNNSKPTKYKQDFIKKRNSGDQFKKKKKKKEVKTNRRCFFFFFHQNKTKNSNRISETVAQEDNLPARNSG